MASIPLHPKHGLNPTMEVCFWCGEDTGAIALLGNRSQRITGRDEAPRRTCLNYEPCPACQEKMALGVTLMEHDGKKPTGRWLVIKPEAIRRIVNDDSLARTIENAGKAFVEPEVFNQLNT